MITGIVNSALEASVQLKIEGAGGQHVTEAVVDTGFSGFLTLPPVVIASLGLAFVCWQPGVLADGSTGLFQVYQGTVVWDGHPKSVEVEAADCVPLIGMALLSDYELHVQVRNAGVVRIDALP